MPKGMLCEGIKNEIHFEEECKNATLNLGLDFGAVVDDPIAFPRCHFRNDTEQKVDYNKNPSKKRVFGDLRNNDKDNNLAICITCLL